MNKENYYLDKEGRKVRIMQDSQNNLEFCGKCGVLVLDLSEVEEDKRFAVRQAHKCPHVQDAK